jgi:hypothetical protein
VGRVGQAREVGPDHAVEDVQPQGRDGGRQCVHAHRRAAGGAPLAGDAVGQQADGQHVIQVGVGDQDVVDARHLLQREIAHTGAGVDENVVVEQEGSGSVAGGNRSRATEDADLHGRGRHEVPAPGGQIWQKADARRAGRPAQGKAPRFRRR